MTMQDGWSEGTIAIRPYTIDDVPDLFAAAVESIREVSPWLPWLHDDRAAAREYIHGGPAAWNDGTDYSFCIRDEASDHYLGGVGINTIRREERFGNLGYWVRSSATGRGVATAATRLAARFAFQETDLERLEIVIAVGNGASVRVAQKAGAHNEGVLRNRLRLRGEPVEAHMFSLIPSDLDR